MMDADYRRKLVPEGEIKARINRFRMEMVTHSFDSALVVSRANYYYFSGTSQLSILYVPLEGDTVLFVKRDINRAREESAISCIVPFKSPRQLPDLIKDCGGKMPRTIGIELDVLPALDFFRYQEIFSRSEFVNATPAIMKCRMKKTPFEIEQIKTACLIGEEMLEAGRHLLKPGITEIEFAILLDLEARKRGHEGTIHMRGLNVEAYSWHVLSGSSACSVTDSETPCGGQGMSPAFPRGASNRRIKAHEPVMVDVPVCYNGYLADQTRIFCIGELPDKFLNAYEFCREVQQLTIEKARPGANCEELFLLGQAMARDRGYDRCYMGFDGGKTAFVGHGIGLEVNETPVLGLKQNYPLQSGSVVAIEPKVVFPEEGAVGIESMYHITDDGYEKLSTVEDGIFQI